VVVRGCRSGCCAQIGGLSFRYEREASHDAVKVASATLSTAIAPGKMPCRSCALFLIAVYISGHCIAPATRAGSSPDAWDVAQTLQREMRIDVYLASQETQLEEIRGGCQSEPYDLNVALESLYNSSSLELFQARKFKFWFISSTRWQLFDSRAYAYMY
jgi:hypothetical protein